MRRSAVTFCVFTAFVTVALPGTVVAGSIVELCADRWPHDKAKRKICVRRQDDGAIRAQQFIKRHDIAGKAVAKLRGEKPHPDLKLFKRCTKLWRIAKFDVFDYEMVDRCLRKKYDAYNPRRGTDGAGIRPPPDGEPPGNRLEDKLGPFE